jgi:hypothetical protein
MHSLLLPAHLSKRCRARWKTPAAIRIEPRHRGHAVGPGEAVLSGAWCAGRFSEESRNALVSRGGRACSAITRSLSTDNRASVEDLDACGRSSTCQDQQRTCACRLPFASASPRAAGCGGGVHPGCTGTGPELATLASRLSALRHTEPGGAAGCSLSCVYRQRVCFDERSSGRENRPVQASRLRLVNHHPFPGATGISGCNIKYPRRLDSTLAELGTHSSCIGLPSRLKLLPR